jgi:hypothetical protein
LLAVFLRVPTRMTDTDRTDRITSGPEADGSPDPDILPEDAEARGAQTIPGVTQTGTTTPPISGWGDVPGDDEATPPD